MEVKVVWYCECPQGQLIKAVFIHKSIIIDHPPPPLQRSRAGCGGASGLEKALDGIQRPRC